MRLTSVPGTLFIALIGLSTLLAGADYELAQGPETPLSEIQGPLRTPAAEDTDLEEQIAQLLEENCEKQSSIEDLKSDIEDISTRRDEIYALLQAVSDQQRMSREFHNASMTMLYGGNPSFTFFSSPQKIEEGFNSTPTLDEYYRRTYGAMMNRYTGSIIGRYMNPSMSFDFQGRPTNTQFVDPSLFYTLEPTPSFGLDTETWWY